MKESVELSILMPCLNEEKTIGVCIEKAKTFLLSQNVTGEIIIADNGSTDQSVKIAKELGAKVIEIQQKGYGSALKGGIAACSGKYIIMGDSDDSYDFQNLMPFLVKLREGYDLVMGNRFQGGIKKGAMPFLHRYLGNPVLSGIGRLFFRIPIKDFHCGLRGFRKKSIQEIDLQTTGMEFASEMVIKASLNGLNLCEVPTTLSPDGRDRPPHLRSWLDGWRHLRFLLSFSPRWLFLYPGFLFMSLGLFFSILISITPIRIKDMIFDIHSLLIFNMLILIGFNLILFSIQTRIYTMRSALIPESEIIQKMSKYFSLERGIIIGTLIMGLGIVFAVNIYIKWSQNDFNYLETRNTMRQFIPAVFSIVIGSQIIFSSFFLSILGVKTKRLDS